MAQLDSVEQARSELARLLVIRPPASPPVPERLPSGAGGESAEPAPLAEDAAEVGRGAAAEPAPSGQPGAPATGGVQPGSPDAAPVQPVSASPAQPMPAVDAAEDELTDEQRDKAKRLTEEKKIANDRWLKLLGRWIWGAMLVLALGSVGGTFLHNDGPLAARRIDARSARIDRALSQAEDLLKGSPGLDADRRRTLGEIAVRIRDEAATIPDLASNLPAEWNGELLAGARRTVAGRAATLQTAAAQLITDTENPAPPDPKLTESLVRMRVALKELDHAELAPGITWPWKFDDSVAEGFVYATLLTLVVLGGLSMHMRADGGLRQFLIGRDGRFSTSQTQAALWTVAVFFLLAHLLLRRVPGQFDELNETYLLLLGGPYAAWVLGGAITRGKLSTQDIQKVTTPEAQVRDLVCDDDGRANLTDAQFFFFSTLALVGVFVAFYNDPKQLPKIPAGLAMLTSAGALVYTGKKSLDKNAPIIFSVTTPEPGPIVSGRSIRIRGENFLPPGAGGDLDVLTTGVTVRFKSGATVIDKRVAARLTTELVTTAQQARAKVANLSTDEITLVVPTLPAGPATIIVIPASGTPTGEHPIVLAEPVVIASAAPTADGKIRLVGVGFAPDGHRAYTTVAVGAATAVSTEWISDQEILADVPPGTTGPVSVVLTNVVGTSTRTVTLG